MPSAFPIRWKKLQITHKCDKPERSKDGTALWIVGSFMNHTKKNWKKILTISNNYIKNKT
jgi:hypothetical protein